MTKLTNHPLMPLSLAVLSFILVACSTPTRYKPAGDGGPGYREQKITENQYRINFEGNDLTPRETVETYLLYRAAELTQSLGFDYFVVNDHSTDVERDTGSVGLTATYGQYLTGPMTFPYYAHGYPWAATSIGGPLRSGRQYEATAYVSMHKGDPPPERAGAFKAGEVLQNLGTRVKRP